MNQFKLLSVIIPVYNEETTIGEVIDRVARLRLPIETEIVVVDDASRDGTAEVLSGRAALISRQYRAQANAGKGAAIRTGLALARGDILLLQDADLELNPEEYPRLLEPILAGECQVVYGSRFLAPTDRVPAGRRLANRFLTRVTNLLYRCRLTDMETAYKVFTADVMRRVRLTANRFDIEPEITARICQAGYSIREVPVSYHPRTAAEGKKIRWSDGVAALWRLARCRLDVSGGLRPGGDQPLPQKDSE